MPSLGAARGRRGFCRNLGSSAASVAAMMFTLWEGGGDMSWNTEGCCCL